jgi:hypothetical protein
MSAHLWHLLFNDQSSDHEKATAATSRTATTEKPGQPDTKDRFSSGHRVEAG